MKKIIAVDNSELGIYRYQSKLTYKKIKFKLVDVCDNLILEDIIKSNGKLFWTTPWVWRIHGYPDDYWRYTPSAVKQIFSSMNWTFVGFEIPFDDNKRSLLFDWEDGMTNHIFEFTRQGLGKLKRPVDVITYETLSTASEKDVTMVSETQSQVFSTKKFDVDTYATLVSGGSIVMVPMCTLFMVGEKCE